VWNCLYDEFGARKRGSKNAVCRGEESGAGLMASFVGGLPQDHPQTSPETSPIITPQSCLLITTASQEP